MKTIKTMFDLMLAPFYIAFITLIFVLLIPFYFYLFVKNYALEN